MKVALLAALIALIRVPHGFRVDAAAPRAYQRVEEAAERLRRRAAAGKTMKFMTDADRGRARSGGLTV